MAGFARLLVGLLALPACWGMTRVLAEAIVVAAGAETVWSAGTLAFLAGLVGFAVVRIVLPRPVRTYVFGHELTHALWGLLFGARPRDLRVSAKGGSVRLTKTNVLITLAPYFFPFYTFVVVLLAVLTYAFVRPLPGLPAWLFLVGFTWSFHALFTLETLTQRQPDIKLYGRIFSWTFIYLANLAVVLVGLAAMTPLTFVELGRLCGVRVSAAYCALADGVRGLVVLCGG